MAKKKETEFDKLARLIKSESDEIRRNMAAKDDVVSVYRVRATKDEIAEIRREMATSADIEDAKEEIIKGLQPLQNAVDKDALAIVDHAARIIRIEDRLAIKNKSR